MALRAGDRGGRRSGWNSVRAANPIQRRRRGINRSRNYNKWPYLGNLWQLNYRPRHARPRNFRQSKCPQKRWIRTICRIDLLRPTVIRSCRTIGLMALCKPVALEGSNVDITQEMTVMIRAQQQFSGSARVPPGQLRYGRKIDTIVVILGSNTDSGLRVLLFV